MDLDRHVEELRRHLTAAVDGGDEATRDTAERLGAALDAAAHLVLLDVLGEAAAEVTRELAPGAVEVRLRGRQPELLVTAPAESEPPTGARVAAASAVGAADPGAGDDGATARINLRLSETLKAQVDRAASEAGTSTNTWLVRAATAALASPPPAAGRTASRRAGLAGDRLTGWVR